MDQEIRIGMIGSVDSGKSSITGVLINDELDDGRGKARSNILKHPHEKESGRSSSISQNYIKVENKIFDFVDLAGHEKYLKTTISGIKRCLIDYAAVVVGANMGVLKMTREHLGLAIALNLPIFIILTKIDLSPNHIKENTITTIIKILKKYSKKRQPIVINDIKDLDTITDKFNTVPIFPISSVTGDGLDILKSYTFNLNSYSSYDDKKDKDVSFIIDCRYMIKGIGIVISGVMNSGTINKGDTLYLGPINNKFIKVIIRSIHNNFKEYVNTLYAGQGGCFNIKPAVSREIIKRGMIKKGMHLVTVPKLFSKFDAEIKIIQHPTTIKVNYEPTIHCGSIVQSARIEKMDKDYLRAGDKTNATFRFCYHPELIEVGNILIFREGNAKGIGRINNIYN